MKTIMFYNAKGGVGKTSSAHNVGAALANMGSKVLLIDIDQQCNLSQSVGVEYDPNMATIYNSFMMPKSELPIIKITPLLHIVPSSVDVATLDVRLSSAVMREFILKNHLYKLQKANVYDYVVIDCPPSSSIQVINALAASDKVYIPLEAEFFAFKGIQSLLSKIDEVQEQANPQLEIGGVFLTMFEPNKNLSKNVEQAIKDQFGDKLFKTTIRRNIKISEAQSQGQSIFDYDPDCNGARDYKLLTEELVAKIESFSKVKA